MQLIVSRHDMRILTETPQDHAFVEEVLGLRQQGDVAVVRRVSDNFSDRVSLEVKHEDRCGATAKPMKVLNP